MRRAALVCLTLAACSFDPRGTSVDAGDPDGAELDASDPGPDAADVDAPVIPIDAGIDAPTCVPSCNGFILTSCATGEPVTTDCPAGCNPTSFVCQVFQPSNGLPTAAAQAATVAISVPAGRAYVFNTDNGEIRSWAHAAGYTDEQVVRGAGTGVVNGVDFQVITQTSGPDIGTWSLQSFALPDGDSWVDLRGARPAAIVAAGPVVVHGWIDGGAGYDLQGRNCQTCGGSGGGRGADGGAQATGCARGGNGTGASGSTPETGGAGGGMSTVGGTGGGGPAGSSIASCAPETLIPLVGGSGGGRGHNQTPIGLGGGGGGAFQLVSLTSIDVSGVDAVIDAGGEGGDGISDGSSNGGGGGGSGGAILLEAPSVTVDAAATITANGGGGGAGNAANNGGDGRFSATPAPGGLASDGTATSLGAGGHGGTGSGAGLTPGNGVGGGDGGGGGGGAAGRIRVNTTPSRPRNLSGVFSPPNTSGTRPAL